MVWGRSGGLDYWKEKDYGGVEFFLRVVRVSFYLVDWGNNIKIEIIFLEEE